MKKYKVTLEYGKTFELEIDAESEDEAEQLADAEASELIAAGEINLRKINVEEIEESK